MFKFIKNWKAKQQFKREVLKSLREGPYSTNLYNSNWLINNYESLMEILPETQTHIDNIDWVDFGLKMTMLEVPWEKELELKNMIGYFETINMIIRQSGGYLIKKQNDNPFGDAVRDLKRLQEL